MRVRTFDILPLSLQPSADIIKVDRPARMSWYRFRTGLTHPVDDVEACLMDWEQHAALHSAGPPEGIHHLELPILSRYQTRDKTLGSQHTAKQAAIVRVGALSHSAKTSVLVNTLRSTTKINCNATKQRLCIFQSQKQSKFEFKCSLGLIHSTAKAKILSGLWWAKVVEYPGAIYGKSRSISTLSRSFPTLNNRIHRVDQIRVQERYNDQPLAFRPYPQKHTNKGAVESHKLTSRPMLIYPHQHRHRLCILELCINTGLSRSCDSRS